MEEDRFSMNRREPKKIRGGGTTLEEFISPRLKIDHRYIVFSVRRMSHGINHGNNQLSVNDNQRFQRSIHERLDRGRLNGSYRLMFEFTKKKKKTNRSFSISKDRISMKIPTVFDRLRKDTTRSFIYIYRNDDKSIVSDETLSSLSFNEKNININTRLRKDTVQEASFLLRCSRRTFSTKARGNLEILKFPVHECTASVHGQTRCQTRERTRQG